MASWSQGKSRGGSMGAKKRDKRGADGKAEMIHQGDKQKLAVPDIKLGSKPPRFARVARIKRVEGKNRDG